MLAQGRIASPAVQNLLGSAGAKAGRFIAQLMSDIGYDAPKGSFPWGDPGSHLIHGSLAHRSPHP